MLILLDTVGYFLVPLPPPRPAPTLPPAQRHVLPKQSTMMAFVCCACYALAGVVSVFVRRALGQRCDPEEGEEEYYYGEASDEQVRAGSNEQALALVDKKPKVRLHCTAIQGHPAISKRRPHTNHRRQIPPSVRV